MALAPCRECGREVSTEAQTCPQCGVPAPTREGRRSGTRSRFSRPRRADLARDRRSRVRRGSRHLKAEIQRDLDRLLDRLGGRTPAQALCAALGLSELPPLVPTDGEEVTRLRGVESQGAGCRRITQAEQSCWRSDASIPKDARCREMDCLRPRHFTATTLPAAICGGFGSNGFMFFPTQSAAARSDSCAAAWLSKTLVETITPFPASTQ